MIVLLCSTQVKYGVLVQLTKEWEAYGFPLLSSVRGILRMSGGGILKKTYPFYWGRCVSIFSYTCFTSLSEKYYSFKNDNAPNSLHYATLHYAQTVELKPSFFHFMYFFAESYVGRFWRTYSHTTHLSLLKNSRQELKRYLYKTFFVEVALILLPTKPTWENKGSLLSRYIS